MIPKRLIKIGSIYLTDTQLVDGTRYLSEVKGLDALDDDQIGFITIAADGSPYKFLEDNVAAGFPISIDLTGLFPSDRASLKTAINTAQASDALVRVVFSDGIDDCDLNCLFGVPGVPKSIEFGGSFTKQKISLTARINLTTVSRN